MLREQHVGRRPVQPGRRRAVERERAVRPKTRWAPSGASGHAGQWRRAVLGEPDRQRHAASSQRARPSVKPAAMCWTTRIGSGKLGGDRRRGRLRAPAARRSRRRSRSRRRGARGAGGRTARACAFRRARGMTDHARRLEQLHAAPKRGRRCRRRDRSSGSSSLPIASSAPAASAAAARCRRRPTWDGEHQDRRRPRRS